MQNKEEIKKSLIENNWIIEDCVLMPELIDGIAEVLSGGNIAAFQLTNGSTYHVRIENEKIQFTKMPF